MKSLESGKEKIQKICDTLRLETLEPAKQEAKEIIENAHLQAAEIVRKAKEMVQEMMQTAQNEIDHKQKTFQSSLQLACRQGIEDLKGKIEKQLLFTELAELTAKEMGDPKWIAELIERFMKILEEKGIDEDVSAIVPKTIGARAINALLVSRFLEKLKNHSVDVGDFKGGIQLKLKDQQITLDLSDTAVRELLAQFLRRDFRDLVFQV